MDKYCRTCFREPGFKKFDFDAVSQITDMRIDEMIICCLQVEISPYEKLPQQICEACLSVLNSTFLLRKQFRQADAEFRKMLRVAPPARIRQKTVPNLEKDLHLLDATILGEDLPGESFEQEQEKTKLNPLADDDQLLLETHEIKIEDDYDEEPTEQQSVAMKKKIMNVFECEQCKHRAFFKGNLVRHQRTWKHSGIKVLTVEKETDEKSALVKKFHSKMYECEQCNFIATYKGNLVRHQLRWKHSGIRIIEPNNKSTLKTIKSLQCCEDCNFQTIVRGNFLHHQKVSKHKNYYTRDIEVDQVLEEFPKCHHCGLFRANLQQHISKWCKVLHGRRRKSSKYGKKYTKSWLSSKETNNIESEAPTNSVQIESEENIPIDSECQEPDESSSTLQTEDMYIEEDIIESKYTPDVI